MKNIILAFAIILATFPLAAQQEYLVSQVNFDRGLYNPSSIGQTDQLNAIIGYRNQWVKFDGAPTTGYFHLKTQLAHGKMGGGLLAAYDKIGVMERSDVFASYAYHLKIDEKSKLSFGLRAGINQIKVTNSSHVYWDKDDELLTNNISRVQPNFGFGMSYVHKDLFLGFSIPSLLNYKPQSFLSANGIFQLERHYHLMGSYKFKLGEEYKLQTGFYTRYVNNSPLEADFNLALIYHDYLSIGSGYRTRDAVFITIGLQFVERLAIGYAYDITLTQLKNFSNGSHEIMLKLGLWQKNEKHIPSLVNEFESGKK